MYLAAALLVVALPVVASAESGDEAAGVPAWMLEDPTATYGNPAVELDVTRMLEEASLGGGGGGTVCVDQCPGDPAFGIDPYTPNCSYQCTPCYENGEICGFICDGNGLDCFPGGCTNPC